MPRRLFPNAGDCAKGDAAPLLTLPLMANTSDALRAWSAVTGPDGSLAMASGLAGAVAARLGLAGGASGFTATRGGGGAEGIPTDGAAAAAALISTRGKSFNSHAGSGAPGTIVTSCWIGVKQSISIWKFHVPSARSVN